MKMQGHNNKLETNVESESQNFGIGDASVVIEILRNRLYEHKIPTLTQEYICNARDAMREAGKGNEFEVTIPTPLNPVFKVRDFGPGITPDRMASVFVLYGASTKRGTNGQTGGFGIGAKSAWSYTDSFTIVSITEGMRRTYVAHTGVNNNGRLDLVSTQASSEPTGTEIQVSVKKQDIDDFRKAVFRAIYFWEQKPVIKGELDIPALVKGDRLSDLVEVVNRNLIPEYVRSGNYYDHNEILAVIDGIVYKVGQKLVDKVKKLRDIQNMLVKNLVLHFGNGVVEVSASRESIADSQHTILALEKLAAKAFFEIQTHITSKFGAVKDNAEYLQTYAELSESYNVDKYAKFGDYSIEHGYIVSENLRKVRMQFISRLNRRGRRMEKINKEDLAGYKRTIEIKHLDNLFYMSADENKILQGKRIRSYLENNNVMILLSPAQECWNTPMVPDPKTNELVKGVPVLVGPSQKDLDATYSQVLKDLEAKDFSGIAFVEQPKEAKTKTLRQKEVFCYHTPGYGRHNYTTLGENTKKWFFVVLKDGSFPYPKHDLRDLECYLEKAENAEVCGLSAATAKKVMGDPNFLPLDEYIANFKATKTDIARQKKWEAENKDVMDSLAKVKGIDDPLMVEMADEYKTFVKVDDTLKSEIVMAKIRQEQEVKDFIVKDKQLTDRLKKDYPLVLDVSENCNHKDELVVYINAKYNNKKGRK